MSLALGTGEGVFKAKNGGSDGVECVLDDVKVFDLAAADGVCYAATDDGLYRSSDDLDTWEMLGDLEDGVTAVGVSPDGETVYVGTMPAKVYTSTDDGETFRLKDNFHTRFITNYWFNEVVPPHVRSLATHPETPNRVVAGIDGGGVHVSEDRGDSWTATMTGITHYIHHVLILGPGHYVASSDAGLFGTRNNGRWWDYLWTPITKHRYFREAFEGDGVVYAGGARSDPAAWHRDGTADAAFYEMRWEEREPEMELVSYPDEPDVLVNCGESHDGRLLAGTTGGHLLRQNDGEWETATEIPGELQIRKLCSV